MAFEGNRIILTIPPSSAAGQTDRESTAESGFSPAFRKAAIEAIASIPGNTIRVYEGRAADSVALAQAAASNDDDSRGLEFLRNEFNGIKGWADHLIDVRNSLNGRAFNLGRPAQG
jgi:hypothetical protein